MNAIFLHTNQIDYPTGRYATGNIGVIGVKVRKTIFSLAREHVTDRVTNGNKHQIYKWNLIHVYILM